MIILKDSTYVARGAKQKEYSENTDTSKIHNNTAIATGAVLSGGLGYGAAKLAEKAENVGTGLRNASIIKKVEKTADGNLNIIVKDNAKLAKAGEYAQKAGKNISNFAKSKGGKAAIIGTATTVGGLKIRRSIKNKKEEK